jgi:hypothetical protein
MSSLDRLREYAKPMKGPHGAASSPENLAEWSERASANSKIAPRAKDGEMSLPSTKVKVRDSSMKPLVSRNVDRQMAGKDDLNHVGGSDYMKSVRREA